ncbi:hypothetical protein [Croceimicrobium sp.]|uniref:hypothetical protein n=1 Tax=Croceimicrobium sp. TaxID=2828340 RepID=UPI003BAA490E
MKSLSLFILLCSCLLGSALHAQADYRLEIDTLNYQSKTEGTLVFPASNWDPFQSAQINLGFNFPFMDTVISSVKLEASGRLVFDTRHHYWLDLNTIAWLRAAPGLSSSPVRLIRESQANGAQKVILQFENARFDHNPSKAIHFQIWINEQDASLSLHMGPHDTVDVQNLSMGPFLAYSKLESLNPLKFEQYHCWYGSTGQLKDTLVENRSFNAFPSYSINSLWAENSLIRLIPTNTIGQSEIQKSDFQFIHKKDCILLPEGLYQYRICQLNGICLEEGTIREKLELGALRPGFYLIQFASDQHFQTLKIQIQ